MPSLIVGVENPLLDISVSVDTSILTAYHLESNSAILADAQHLPLLEEIKKNPTVFYSAGGATQNAMRMAQWMLGSRSRVAYMGCVGDDDNMKIMRRALEQAHVQVQYQIHPTEPTGTCGVLLSNHGKDRSLVANLGAANHLSVTHVQQHEDDLLRRADVIYSSGFLVTSSPDSLRYLARYARSEGKKYVFNLAAPFLCQVPAFRTIIVEEILPLVDFFIGSDCEALALGDALGWGSDLIEIAEKIAAIDAHNRTVIITCGSQDTLVCIQEKGQITTTHAPIHKVSEEEIIDANGCGDAYAGGFCAGLLLHKSVLECCRAGAYAASEVIKRRGCTVPESSSFQFSNC